MPAPAPDKLQPIDKRALYRIDLYTDGMHGDLMRLVPVGPDGLRDDARQVIYRGSLKLTFMGKSGDFKFTIKADSLEEALDKFSDEGTDFANKMLADMQSEYIRRSLTAATGPSLKS